MADNPDPQVLICVTIADTPLADVTATSLPDRCECGTAVWISESGRAATMADPWMRVLCVPCGFNLIESADEADVRPVPGGFAEAARHLRRPDGSHN